MNYTSFYYRGYVNLEVDYSSQLTVLIVSWNAVLIIFGKPWYCWTCLAFFAELGKYMPNVVGRSVHILQKYHVRFIESLVADISLKNGFLTTLHVAHWSSLWHIQNLTSQWKRNDAKSVESSASLSEKFVLKTEIIQRGVRSFLLMLNSWKKECSPN